MISKTLSSSRQTLLTESSKLYSTQCSAEITDKIVDFVALDLKPLCTVDIVGFQRLLGFVESGYKTPYHTHVNTMCKKKYEKFKDVVAASLVDQFVLLTTDILTSRATEA